jgi:hypothetical protein
MRQIWSDEYLEITSAGVGMKVDLVGLRKRVDRQLKEIEEREAHLRLQLEHLAVVQTLAEPECVDETEGERLDMDDFRRAILGGNQ